MYVHSVGGEAPNLLPPGELIESDRSQIWRIIIGPDTLLIMVYGSIVGSGFNTTVASPQYLWKINYIIKQQVFGWWNHYFDEAANA